MTGGWGEIGRIAAPPAMARKGWERRSDCSRETASITAEVNVVRSDERGGSGRSGSGLNRIGVRPRKGGLQQTTFVGVTPDLKKGCKGGENPLQTPRLGERHRACVAKNGKKCPVRLNIVDGTQEESPVRTADRGGSRYLWTSARVEGRGLSPEEVVGQLEKKARAVEHRRGLGNKKSTVKRIERY